jgi:hypothetical protein
MAAARGMAIPPADEVPPELEYRLSKKPTMDQKDKSLKNLTLPITGRSQSYQSDHSGQLSPANSSLPAPSPTSPPPSSPGGPLFRARAKTLASLTTSSRNNSQQDMTPREFQLPTDPFVNGQPVEVYLYKDAAECPICFLYYPPYLNTTRCCEQPICSECFVQIKRPDPHPPEHEQPDPNAPPLSDEDRHAQEEGLLVSEVAACPYCKQPEFGITYTSPPFRRGLTYGSGTHPYQVKSAVSSQTSLSSGTLSPGRRRGTSLSATAPEVITTDKVRPDWATKLAAARAHAARRSAAATALHTAAYMMNNTNPQDPRAFGPFGRRIVLRRPGPEGSDQQASHLSALAMLAERHAARQQEEGQGQGLGRPNPFAPPPRASSSRRNRMDDLEDMMMMEAIRLSLAAEEDRRKKEEKEAKKEAKKKAKEQKKEEKAARKSGLFPTYSNSSLGEIGSSAMERSRSNLSSLPDEDSAASGKGKGVDRSPSPPDDDSLTMGEASQTSRFPEFSFSGNSTSQESLAPSIPIPGSGEPFKRSHLRQMSNASSSASSVAGGMPSGSVPTASTPPGSLEPMFNFQSLAAMIGEEEKDGSAHVEHADTNGVAANGADSQAPNGSSGKALGVEEAEEAPAGLKGSPKEKRPIPASEEIMTTAHSGT